MKKINYLILLSLFSCTSAVDQLANLKKPAVVIYECKGCLILPPGGSEMIVKDVNGKIIKLSPFGLPSIIEKYKTGDTIK